ncbi:MAG: polysaccharide biosynthesis tyrosine autokinase [Planctomycetota bacterium]
MGALWRYRWAVILPGIVGGVIGFLVYCTTEETYRSTTKIMVESNRPPIFHAITGEVMNGVPDIEVLGAELYGDTVAQMAFNNVNMQPYRELYDNNLSDFTLKVLETLEIEPIVTDVKTAESLVTYLHFDSKDPEHAEAAIKAYSKALQDYYNEKHKSTRSEFIRLVEIAIKELSPTLSDMERRYNEFRRDAPLSWDVDGNAINPHREQKAYLTKLRAERVQHLRSKEALLASMEAVATEDIEPRIAISVMSQLLGVKVASGTTQKQDPLAGDNILAVIDLEKQLLPLIVERNQMERELGPSHPTVRTLDEELNTTRTELMRLVREQSDRITKLREDWYESLGDPDVHAQQTVVGVLGAQRAEVTSLQRQVAELDEQIVTEKALAAKLAQYEQDDEAMKREIEQHRELMRQLEEKMGHARLSDDESVTQVIELKAPSKAVLVGPVLLKLGGIGTFLGLLLGGGLAVLLEKNANTFRDSEEVAKFLGVTVLTHIPFFRGKRRKTKKGEVDPYKTLSTDLAVVHQPSSIASESVRSLRTAVFFDLNKIGGGKVIQITSPLPGDGKSTLACNLACSIAQSGKRVLAIDCDLRRPQLTDNFDCDDKLGLTNVLNGECEPLDAAHPTPLPKLSIMPSGPVPNNPAEALSLPLMNELLDYLREQFDYIVLDTPPLLVVTDPSITASMADAVILTLRIRRKSKPNAREALQILSGVGANVLGVVINNSDEAGASDGYRGYGHYRYGAYHNHYYRRGTGGAGTSVAVSNGRLRRTNEGRPVAMAAGPAKSASESPSSNGEEPGRE